MTIELFDRLAYLDRDDFPEAEFLATGMSGEDVVVTAMEPAVRRRILLTGAEGSGSRVGHVARRCIAATSRRAPLPSSGCAPTSSTCRCSSLARRRNSASSTSRIPPEMRPWTMPGRYDKPIQRRLAGEGGVARGTFATVKRRGSARIHADGLAAMSGQARRRSRNSQPLRAGLPSGRRPLIRRTTEPSCGRHGLFVPSDSLRHSTCAGERWSTPSPSSALCSSGGASASCGPATPLTHRPSHLAT